MRTTIYVDGFNLYYRALKDTPYKWLDLVKLSGILLKDHHKITCVKYFTARIKPGIKDPGKPNRQDVYLRALKTCPEVEIFYGHFLSHTVSARLATPIGRQKYADIIKTEEKGSDVNIAVHLLNDAWLNHYDSAIILSNDSDLAEAMKLVRHQHPQKILGVFTPGEGNTSKQLKNHAHFVRQIRTGGLKQAQFPDNLPGTNITKPIEWR